MNDNDNDKKLNIFTLNITWRYYQNYLLKKNQF